MLSDVLYHTYKHGWGEVASWIHAPSKWICAIIDTISGIDSWTHMGWMESHKCIACLPLRLVFVVKLAIPQYQIARILHNVCKNFVSFVTIFTFSTLYYTQNLRTHCEAVFQTAWDRLTLIHVMLLINNENWTNTEWYILVVVDSDRLSLSLSVALWGHPDNAASVGAH